MPDRLRRAWRVVADSRLGRFFTHWNDMPGVFGMPSFISILLVAFLAVWAGRISDRAQCHAINNGRVSVRRYVITPVEDFISSQPGGQASDLASILREGRKHLHPIDCP